MLTLKAIPNVILMRIKRYFCVIIHLNLKNRLKKSENITVGGILMILLLTITCLSIGAYVWYGEFCFRLNK